MPRKASTKKTPEVVPGENGLNEPKKDQAQELKVIEAEEVEVPQELAVIKQEYGLGIPDAKVEQHILTYSPYFKQLVDLEAELTDLLTKPVTKETGEEAKKLRLKYRDIRTGAEKQKKADKGDMIKEGTFLDKVNKRIKEGAELKETKCEEIENHLENIRLKEIEALKAERKAILDALDYDTDFLTLEDMPQESFDRLVLKATEAKEALALSESQRVEREAEEQRKKTLIDERIKDLNSIGLLWDSEKQGYNSPDGFVGVGMVNDGAEEDFNKTYDAIEAVYTQRKETEAQELKDAQEKAQRQTNRINAITKLGLTYDTVLEAYTGYGQTITIIDVKDKPGQDFQDIYDNVKSIVTAKRAEEKKAEDARIKKEQETLAENNRLKKAEEARLAEVKRLQEEEEAKKKALLLAPDKEKFKAFYIKLKALIAEFPEMSSDIGKEAGARFKEASQITLKVAQQEAQKLV